MAISGVMIGSSLRAARELSLAELLERESSNGSLTVPAKLSLLDVNPGTIVNVTSALDGWGRGSKTGRRIGRLQKIRITSDKKVIAFIEDAHASQKLGIVDALASSVPSTYGDGVAGILPHNGGGGFYGAGFFRSSNAYAWCEQTKRVIQIPNHMMHVERDGTHIEGLALNELLHSGFDSGLTGWSTAGTGVNGSSIATDATRLLFDPAIGSGMPYSILIVAGTPHAAQLSLFAGTGTIPANTKVTLSVDTVAYSGVGLDWYLQRAVDGFYWDGTTWAAPVVKGGTCAVRTSTQQRPEVLQTIDVGGTNTTLTFVLGFPTGGTSGRAASVYHVQISQSFSNVLWGGGSRVVSFGSVAQRANTFYGYANETGRRSWPAARGTMHMKFTPTWNSAATTLSYTFFSVEYDGSNYIRGFYNGATGQVVFRRASTASGVVSASGTFAVTAETPIYLAFRWASNDGAELDDLYGAAPASEAHFDVWAGAAGNLTKLATNHSVQPVESTNSQFQIGGSPSLSESLEGRVEIIRVQPRVLSDEEMMRWAS